MVGPYPGCPAGRGLVWNHFRDVGVDGTSLVGLKETKTAIRKTQQQCDFTEIMTC